MSELASVIYGLSGSFVTNEERAFFSKVNPYGYILFARNCENPKQVKSLVRSLRDISGRERLPILIDQEGGRVARLKPPAWPTFPPARVFAKLAERSLAKATRATYLNARLIAHELHSLGITVNCAPLADLPVSGAHDIIGDRAFGNTPEQVISLARAMAEGLADGGVVSVLKHIPGHGRASSDSHEELPVVRDTLEQLRKSDFLPFIALNDLPMAMTAHVLYSVIDDKHLATVSPKVIELIRKELRFDGLLMSDDISMKAMSGTYGERAKAVLKAGCDVVLHCNGDMKEMHAIAKAVTPMTGASLERGEKAMVLTAPMPFDTLQARRELDSLLAKAA